MKAVNNEMAVKMPTIVLTPLRLSFQIAARLMPLAAVGVFTWLLASMPRKKFSLVLMVHGLQGSAVNYFAMIPAPRRGERLLEEYVEEIQTMRDTGRLQIPATPLYRAFRSSMRVPYQKVLAITKTIVHPVRQRPQNASVEQVTYE